MCAVGSPGNIYLLSYAFNQDFSCFVCGTTAGFRVYTASPVCEVHRREGFAAFRRRSVVLGAMLFKTNIFAMVTTSDDATGGLNKVQIYDDQKGKFVGELRSRNEVKGVVLRRDVIAMVCEYAIYVYTCDKLRVILHLTTNANARGICALAPASEPWILCCPGQSTGAVRVQVGADDRATHVFTAHRTGLAALSLTASAALLATASENGTVVKVFQTSDGQLMYRLRRSTRPATISCLTFSPDQRFLAEVSSSSTVHIFKLDGEEGREVASFGAESQDDSRPQTMDMVAATIHRAVTSITSADNVVKGVMPMYFNDMKSFARFRIPDVDAAGEPLVDVRDKQSRISGPQLAFHRSEPKLFVLNYSGVLYECSFRPDEPRDKGTQECAFVSATTWFAVRPDFKLQGPSTKIATVAGGAQEDDQDAEEWQLL